ncbi:MAG: response regulator [Deltaproteobacteria bacterium]|nr:response regulator [Deltaproteobacteria bacterium]
MGNEIDLVILDMVMPGMDGGRTFDLIREIQPGMPVLLSSGYAINAKRTKSCAEDAMGSFKNHIISWSFPIKCAMCWVKYQTDSTMILRSSNQFGRF